MSRLLLVVALELAYMVFTRTWLREHSTGIPRELWTTAFRLVNAAAYWALFKDLLAARAPGRARLKDPLLLAGLAAALLAPVLVGSEAMSSPAAAWVFAATSLAVGLKEELFFRGILQSLLETRHGLIKALVASNLLFIVYHYGAQPMTPAGVTEFFVMGCAFGLLYAATGSLVLPVAWHALYDAVWCFTPFTARPWPRPWAAVFQLAALACVALWARRAAAKR
ncbi:MAG: CPBP family intramembrane glutamic endopeptidase [Elusimicrobiota bacterium]|nr:CPBP family intramembrane glutamic endopeptidase [Elusimicrobiota bacterium]